jgi:WD40 repeat protein/serine/threonine protein kinase
MNDVPSPETPVNPLVALLAEQRRCWQRGERVPVETLLRKFPAGVAHDEVLLDLIYQEFLLREERGETPAVAEYQQRFPYLAEQLRLQFEAHRALAPGPPLDSRGPMSPPSTPETIPEASPPRGVPVVPGYEILEQVGGGGMGVVYRARHHSLNRVVALKILRSGADAGPQERARFRREAEAVASLQHPGIVQIYEVGEHDGCPYLALEWVEGGSLARRLDGAPWPPPDAAHLVRALALAVDDAHRHGIIHRDLKPGNVLLASASAACGLAAILPASPAKPQAAEVVPKITDFGLAKRLELPALTRSEDAVLGTPSYMAPEQARGKSAAAGPLADVYSLGAILYELLTGRPPFRGETTIQTLAQVLVDDPVPLRQLQPRLPRDVETICLKCLHKEPARRYSSAAALAEDLEHFLQHRPIRARPLGVAGRLLRWGRREPVVASLLGLVVVVVLVGFGLVTWKWLEARHEWQRAENQRGLTQTALGEAQLAREDAESKRRRAEEAEGRARDSAAAEKAARLKADRLSAFVALDRGQNLCEQGDAARGMLWLARALQIAASTTDRDLERAVRTDLAAWKDHVYSLQTELRWAAAGSAVALSPDGRSLLSGGGNNLALFYDVATDKPRLEVLFKHKDRVAAVAVSPDGKTVLTGSHDGTARLWDAATGKPLCDPLPHPARVNAVAFRGDGKAILTGCGDVARGEAWMWEVPGGKSLAGPLKHAQAVRAVAFSPDGKAVLTASEDHTARLWEADTGKPLGEPLRHGDAVLAAAFGPDGKTVLTGSWDTTARLWDAGTGRPLEPFLRHSEAVFAVAYSPDGQTAITGCQGAARLWDVANRRQLGSRLPQTGGAYAVGFSRDGGTVLVAGSTVRLWTGPRSPLLRQHEDAGVFAFRPPEKSDSGAGSQILVTSSAAGWGRLEEAASGKPAGLVVEHRGVINAAAFSPDGKTLLTGSADGTARLWDVSTGKPQGPPLEHAGPVQAVAFSPDGKTALTGSADKTARCWDSATGRPLALLLRHEDAVTLVSFSPDGQTILTRSGDRTLALWETATGKPRGPAFRHEQWVRSAVFSPDGKTVLTASHDSTARLWDPDLTGKTPGRLARPLPLVLHHGGVQVWFAAFHPDGRSVVTGGDAVIKVWDLATGRFLRGVFPHENSVSALAFSPDGKTALTGSWDRTARLWDVPSGRPLGPVLQHPRFVDGVAFSPDGRTLLTVTGPTARFWRAPLPVAGAVERIVLWAEVLTGLTLDEEGIDHPNSPEALKALRQRLADLGGPPP